MAHDAHAAVDHHPGTGARSAGLAFVLGLLVGGLAFFYVLPPGRALIRALVAYGIVIASGGILWMPVFLIVAFLAAREAKYSEPSLALHGGSHEPAPGGDDKHESFQTPPSTYVRRRP